MERNTALFDQIADAIEKKPELYNQGSYTSRTACGTAHCIAGWAVALSGKEVVSYGEVTEHEAAQLLGLSREECDSDIGCDEDERPALFSPRWKPPANETVPQALRRIGRGGAI